MLTAIIIHEKRVEELQKWEIQWSWEASHGRCPYLGYVVLQHEISPGTNFLDARKS